MASFRKRGKLWYFRFTDADGVKVERKGCPDRRETERMAFEAEVEAARLRSGSLDPRDLRATKEGRRPVATHLDDFRTFLLAKGGTDKHADLTHDRCRRVVALVAGASLATIDPTRSAPKAERERARSVVSGMVGSMRLADLTPASVQSALAALKNGGRSLATCNHHRAAIRGFSRWACRDGRSLQDQLAGVSGYNAKEDRRHDRRTLGLDELRRLIEVTHHGKIYREMTGPDRAICYRLAVATGLRFGEIASMSRVSFAVDGPENPTVVVRAAYTKNGDPATLPLPIDLAEDLRAWLAGRSGEGPSFRLPDRGADMLKLDLAVAGIPYRDATGLVFDFHALRCQCATLLDRAGVTPRVVQKTMRHSTLELTGKYTRPRAVDIEQAAGSLPSLRPGHPRSEANRATGTDGRPIGELLAHHLPTGGDGKGRLLSVADGTEALAESDRPSRKSMDDGALVGGSRPGTGGVASSGGGIRTPDTRIMIPLL
jgi:integrase